MASPVLFFLTIGDDPELHQQAYLAILTSMGFLRATPARIVVCTDRPQRYRFFGERIELLVPTPDQLKAWRGRYDLFSRIKIEALKALIDRDGDADLLVLDSDILACKDLGGLLASIAGGHLHMHVIEYPWASPPSPRQKAVWKHLSGKTYAGHTVVADTVMWNAGVQGIPAGRAREVLDKELAVYDAFSDDGLYKLRHTTQQHTISLVMQQAGPLAPALDWFIHYWGNKEGHMPPIRAALAEILAGGMDVDAAVAWCQANPIREPIVKAKGWHRRVLRRLSPW